MKHKIISDGKIVREKEVRIYMQLEIQLKNPSRKTPLPKVIKQKERNKRDKKEIAYYM